MRISEEWGVGGGEREEDGDGGEKVRQASTASVKDVDFSVLTEEGGDEDGGAEKKDSTALLIVFLLMVVVGLGNKIFQKLMTIPMHNYPNFLNVLTTFVFLPVCFAYIVPAVRSGLIPKKQTDLPKLNFLIMGGLDGVAGVLQTFAATYLDGPLLILLGQAAIPVSMVISKYLLRAKYTGFQYLGAVIVVGGIMTVLAPTLTGQGSILWACMMIASTIPMALSSVYKERALGETELDPIYLNGWIALFQFAFCLAFAAPAAYASSPPVTIDQLPRNLYEGMLCYVGINSQTCAPGSSPDCQPDDCARAPVFVNTYLLFNQCYNLLIILIIKYGSANLLYLALTLMVPLGNCAFTLDFVPGHKPLQSTDILGLVIICVGLLCYRFASNILRYLRRGHTDDAIHIDRKPLLGNIQNDQQQF